MNEISDFRERLIRMVESIEGHVLKENNDFTRLAENINMHTHMLLSTTTLKRLWGYIEAGQQKGMRTTTLDIISRYCGYTSYEDFCNSSLSKDQMISSEPNFRTTVEASSMKVGDVLCLMWKPGRKVTVRHDGNCRFTILESIASKLHVGDTFRCERFVEGMPLVLIDLEGLGHDTMNYACAKGEGGLTITY